jgi:hypothetical protein
MTFYSTSAGSMACVYRTATDITTISAVRSVDVLPIVVKNRVNGEGKMVVARSPCHMTQLNPGHLDRWQY